MIPVVGAAWHPTAPEADSYPDSMPVRRRPRSSRAVLAACLLGVVGLLVGAALVLGERLVLSAAAVATYLASVAAARLLSDEHARTRLQAAHDRVVQAQDYRRLFALRVQEQDAFAATMTDRVVARDAQIARLRVELHDAAQRAEITCNTADELARTVSELRFRIRELSSDLDEQKSLASESLAFWYGRHNPSVHEILDWEARNGARAHVVAARDEA